MDILADCARYFSNRRDEGRSLFARLASVASFRDHSTGLYCEPLAVEIFGEPGVHRALRFLHLQLFREWLCLSLERQVGDLDEFLPWPRDEREKALRIWSSFSRYEELIPSDAALPERLLFVSDLDVDFSVLTDRLHPGRARAVSRRKAQPLAPSLRPQFGAGD